MQQAEVYDIIATGKINVRNAGESRKAGLSRSIRNRIKDITKLNTFRDRTDHEMRARTTK